MKNNANFIGFFLLFVIFGQFQTKSESITNIFTVTAYCNCEKCCGKWSKYNKTASGHTPKQGITVAGPRKYKFGTKIQIEGVGERVIQDRLAKKYDNRIDLFFESHKEALKFGKRSLAVIVEN